MTQMQSMAGARPRAQSGEEAPIPIVTLGLSLSLFFVISYVICIAGYLLAPGLPVQHAALSIFLPGFELLTWKSYFLGLVESFVWGWYIALVFGALYNFLSRRIAR
jgi:hypothetical protein